MKQILIILLVIVGTGSVHAQKYFSKQGEISFYSHTPIEDIEAVSNSASTVFDSESGRIQWAVLIKSFEFEKALMQEHFNENYMESSKFPKAKFAGNITNYKDLDFSKDGTYTANVAGELTIRDVTQSVETKAVFTVSEGKIVGTSSLKVNVADYGIEIPAVVRENIAKTIEIKIKADYEVFAKS